MDDDNRMGEMEAHEDLVVNEEIDKELQKRPPQLDIPELDSAEICCEVLVSASALLLSIIEGSLVLPFIMVYAIIMGLGMYLFALPKLCDRSCLALCITPRLLLGARFIAILLLPLAFILAIPATVILMIFIAIATAYVHAYFAILNGRQTQCTEGVHYALFLCSGFTDPIKRVRIPKRGIGISECNSRPESRAGSAIFV